MGVLLLKRTSSFYYNESWAVLEKSSEVQPLLQSKSHTLIGNFYIPSSMKFILSLKINDFLMQPELCIFVTNMKQQIWILHLLSGHSHNMVSITWKDNFPPWITFIWFKKLLMKVWNTQIWGTWNSSSKRIILAKLNQSLSFLFRSNVHISPHVGHFHVWKNILCRLPPYSSYNDICL